VPITRCGLLAAWANAFFAGHASVDQVVDEVTGDDAAHQVVGLPGLGADAVSLRDLLVSWRRGGEPVRVALPVPGDVRGLCGPAQFRSGALDAGEAAMSAGIGVVPDIVDYSPSSKPTDVTWQAFALEPGPVEHESLADINYELSAAIRDAATALTAAGVGDDRAELGDALHDALRDARRAGEYLRLPPGHPPRAVAILAQAERMQAVLELAFADPAGGAVDRMGMAARDSALRPLAVAVRRARVAGYNAR
jgi:hypothetical protein